MVKIAQFNNNATANKNGSEGVTLNYVFARLNRQYT